MYTQPISVVYRETRRWRAIDCSSTTRCRLMQIGRHWVVRKMRFFVQCHVSCLFLQITVNTMIIAVDFLKITSQLHKQSYKYQLLVLLIDHAQQLRRTICAIVAQNDMRKANKEVGKQRDMFIITSYKKSADLNKLGSESRNTTPRRIKYQNAIKNITTLKNLLS